MSSAFKEKSQRKKKCLLLMHALKWSVNVVLVQDWYARVKGTIQHRREETEPTGGY